jgi:hypothetical protein
MATVYRELLPEEAQFLSTAFPAFLKRGSNYPVTSLAFDASSTESAYWKLAALKYGSGNLSLDLIWYADTATSGVVRWEASMAAITPISDSQDVETDSLATAQTVDDTHLGTTAHRLHRATIAISNLDSLAVLDAMWLKVSRLGGHANDTMAGDCLLANGYLSYSDT